MMVARPDSQKSLIVYKHPDQNIPMYSQLTVDSDECAVFFKDGRVVGRRSRRGGSTLAVRRTSRSSTRS